MTSYVICADGACSGNPGPGGFAYEVWLEGDIDGDPIFGGSGSSIQTTNNIMELRATICAIDDFGGRGLDPGTVKLRLDSEYVLKGIFEWLPGWKARGWRTGKNKPVANAEMWKELDTLMSEASTTGLTFEADWVKGHTGDAGNERVDATAQKRRDEAKSEVACGTPSDVSPATASMTTETSVSSTKRATWNGATETTPIRRWISGSRTSP